MVTNPISSPGFPANVYGGNNNQAAGPQNPFSPGSAGEGASPLGNMGQSSPLSAGRNTALGSSFGAAFGANGQTNLTPLEEIQQSGFGVAFSAGMIIDIFA